MRANHLVFPSRLYAALGVIISYISPQHDTQCEQHMHVLSNCVLGCVRVCVITGASDIKEGTPPTAPAPEPEKGC